MKLSLKKRRNALLAPVLMLTLVLAGPLLAPRPAQAQFAVACVNCSSIIQQLLDYAKQLQQYATQLNQYQTQIEQWENQIKNTTSMTSWLFDDAVYAIRDIETIMRNGQKIVYSAQNLEGTFRDIFPDFGTIFEAQETFDIVESFNRHAAISERTYDSALTALRAMRAHSQQMTQEQGRMNQVGSALLSSDGRLDAIQAAGTYSQINAQQLMRLRQVVMSQVDMMATKMAEEQAITDSELAALYRLMSKHPQPTRDTSVTHELFLPGAPTP